jgi:hypothetical protein
MAKDSEDWVSRTSAAYRALNEDPEASSERGRRRLVAFLDLTMNARVREVGPERAMRDLREVIHRAVDNY